MKCMMCGKEFDGEGLVCPSCPISIGWGARLGMKPTTTAIEFSSNEEIIIRACFEGYISIEQQANLLNLS